MLIFEQFGLAVDAPMFDKHYVDIHGLGPDHENDLPAPWHYVMSAESAVKCANVTPDHLPSLGTERNVTRYPPLNMDMPDYMDDEKATLVSVVLLFVTLMTWLDLTLCFAG